MAKKKSSDSKEKKFLNNLDHSKKTGLIVSDLKNPSTKPLQKENLDGLDKEISQSFIHHKLKNDITYSLKSEQKSGSQKSNEIDENASLNPSQNETSTSEKDYSEEDPFYKLDERLNIKETLNFFDETKSDVEENRDEISADEISADEISADEISADEISADEISADEISADEISADEISADEISADEISADKISADEISADEISADKISADEISADEISADEISADEISADEISADEISELDFYSEGTSPDKDGPTQISETKEDSFEGALEDEPHPSPKIENKDEDLEEIHDSTTKDPFESFLENLDEQDDFQKTEDGKTRNWDEFETFDDHKSTAKSVDKKFNIQNINAKLKNFHPENQKLILSLLNNKNYPETSKEVLFADILSDKDENTIVELLKQKEFKKTGYEIFERRDKNRLDEKRIFENVYKQYWRRRRILIFILSSTFLLTLTFAIYFLYQSALPVYLYKKSIAAIEEDNFFEAESYFNEAYNLKPDTTYTKEVGFTFLKKNKVREAKEKFNILLRDFPTDLEAIVANVRFHRILKQYQEAWKLINLAEKFYPQNAVQLTEKTSLLISEGRSLKDYQEAQKLWQQANKIASDLIQLDPAKEDKYLQLKIALAALSGNFELSKNYYQLFQQLNQPYDLESMNIYSDYLFDIKERSTEQLYLTPEQIGTDKRDTYIIKTLDEIYRHLKSRYEEHYYLEIFQARWKSIRKQPNLAIHHAQRALQLIENEKNFFLRDDKQKTLNLLGYINFKRKNLTAAEENFKESLDINPIDPTVNYYLGKINFHHHNLFQIAYKQLLVSYTNWQTTKNLRYADLLYILGYINFNNAKKLSDITTKEKYLKQSVFFWSELAKENLQEKNYLIDFNLATSYLYLKEYDIAEIFYENNLERLQNLLKFFNNKNDSLVRYTDFKREEILLLSDTYNNLAVTQIRKNSKASPSSVEISGVAVEYFIASIILKDKIGDLKAVPYANFHTLNSFGNNFSEIIKQREFQVADASIPKSLLPEVF